MFKKIIFQLFPIIGIVLCCCSSAPSLQTYFVDNQEKNGFISIDVPISVLGLESIEMSSSEKEALSSISKFNILSFSLDSINHTKYYEELLKINQLFTNSSYERIISLGNPKDGKVRVYTVDNNGFLKEIVIFVNSNKTGFAGHCGRWLPYRLAASCAPPTPERADSPAAGRRRSAAGARPIGC